MTPRRCPGRRASSTSSPTASSFSRSSAKAAGPRPTRSFRRWTDTRRREPRIAGGQQQHVRLRLELVAQAEGAELLQAGGRPAERQRREPRCDSSDAENDPKDRSEERRVGKECGGGTG